jgi:hypothetical protein
MEIHRMFEEYLIFWIIQVFILLLGISLGHSMLLFKMRKEENKKRELELALFEKRAAILSEGKQIAHDLEEVLYKAKVQQEIDDILKKKSSS